MLEQVTLFFNKIISNYFGNNNENSYSQSKKYDYDDENEYNYSSDEDTEEYLSKDLYYSKYIKKIKKSQNCYHIHLIDQFNDIFISNENSIYSFYFENKKAPKWFKNIIINKTKEKKLIKKDEELFTQKEDENLFNNKISIINKNDNFKKDYIFFIEENKTFIIIKEIYTTIKYNFCIMAMSGIEKGISSNKRFDYIKYFNELKINCKCNDFEFKFKNGCITNQSLDYILITKIDSIYFSQNSSFEHYLIPNEFILYLLGSFISEFSFNDEWYLFILNDKESLQYIKNGKKI